MKSCCKPQIRPNFLGIGAAKCGTIWLAEVLSRHPQVYMAAEKELVFFSSEKQYRLGMDWYLSHFDRVRHETAVGEFSVSYMSRSSKAASRIQKFNPSMRLIVVFRNPVWRAYSHYRWLRQIGKCDVDFNDALLRFPAIVEEGMYYNKLLPYLDLFPRDQFAFLKFEDLMSNPTKVVHDVLEFIGVCDPDWSVPLINRKVSRTINPRSRVLEKIRIALHQKARKNHLGFLISIAKRTGISDLYRNLNDSRKPETCLGEADYFSLIEKFSGDIAKLADTTGQNFDDWLRYTKR